MNISMKYETLVIFFCKQNMMIPCRSGPRIFSRGGIFKKISKILLTFILVYRLIFSLLPKHYKDPVLTKFSSPQAKFRKKTGK